mmetsp:Transcript_3692/g.13025  ORF Transcript_3692/g.13025 Transcript_3692/m.13025 type:complete len:220 (+) Transcript_3692:472-1131(+)
MARRMASARPAPNARRHCMKVVPEEKLRDILLVRFDGDEERVERIFTRRSGPPHGHAMCGGYPKRRGPHAHVKGRHTSGPEHRAPPLHAIVCGGLLSPADNLCRGVSTLPGAPGHIHGHRRGHSRHVAHAHEHHGPPAHAHGPPPHARSHHAHAPPAQVHDRRPHAHGPPLHARSACACEAASRLFRPCQVPWWPSPACEMPHECHCCTGAAAQEPFLE